MPSRSRSQIKGRLGYSALSQTEDITSDFAATSDSAITDFGDGDAQPPDTSLMLEARTVEEEEDDDVAAGFDRRTPLKQRVQQHIQALDGSTPSVDIGFSLCGSALCRYFAGALCFQLRAVLPIAGVFVLFQVFGLQDGGASLRGAGGAAMLAGLCAMAALALDVQVIF